MRHIAFRLRRGQMLKEEMEARTKEVGAGVLLSVVGGLTRATLRMAGATPDNQAVKSWDGPFEIVAGTGTFSKDGCHVHVALSDRDGNVIGGHLKDGCQVDTTAEVVIGILDDATFTRRPDPATGFDELTVP